MIVLANGIGFLVSIIMPCYNQGVFVAEAIITFRCINIRL